MYTHTYTYIHTHTHRSPRNANEMSYRDTMQKTQNNLKLQLHHERKNSLNSTFKPVLYTRNNNNNNSSSDNKGSCNMYNHVKVHWICLY